MGKKIALIVGVYFIIFPLFSQSVRHANYLPIIERQPDQVVVKIKPLQASGEYLINYRTEGMDDFQVRKMQTDPSGFVFLRIATENFYGRNIEYFLVEKRADGTSAVSLTHTISNFNINFLKCHQGENGFSNPSVSLVREG